MPREKILHLVNGHRILGAERVAAEVCQGLAMYVDPIIGLVNGSQLLKNELICQYGEDQFSVEIFSESWFFEAIRKVSKFCRMHQVKIIHSHGYKSDVMAYGVSLITPGLRLVATNHNHILTSRKEKIYRWLDLKVLNHFSAVVAVSQQVCDDMHMHGLRHDQDVEIIHNGINFSIVPHSGGQGIKKELKVPEDDLVIGIVASLTEEKAHRVLLSSFKILSSGNSSVSLLIVGDGYLREELEQLAIQLDISDKVFFAGHRADISKILTEVDIFVLPSLREGLPMALLEAMSAGLPVIVSAVGAIPRVIDDGKNGFLIPPGDKAVLLDMIAKLVKSSEMRNELGCKARVTVKTQFSREQMVSAYWNIYKRIVSGA